MQKGGLFMVEQTEYSFLMNSLPFWGKITEEQRQVLKDAAISRHYRKNESLHNGSDDCIGFLLVESGQIRVFIVSEAGKEITLYRLFERDICIFSASCIMKNINFEAQFSIRFNIVAGFIDKTIGKT